MRAFLSDMLSVEEQQNTIRYNIQLDHCYTSRLSPNDPVPRDPLPIVDDSPDSNDVRYAPPTSSPRMIVIPPSINDTSDAVGAKHKNVVKSVGVFQFILYVIMSRRSRLINGIVDIFLSGIGTKQTDQQAHSQGRCIHVWWHDWTLQSWHKHCGIA